MTSRSVLVSLKQPGSSPGLTSYSLCDLEPVISPSKGRFIVKLVDPWREIGVSWSWIGAVCAGGGMVGGVGSISM